MNAEEQAAVEWLEKDYDTDLEIVDYVPFYAEEYREAEDEEGVPMMVPLWDESVALGVRRLTRALIHGRPGYDRQFFAIPRGFFSLKDSL